MVAWRGKEERPWFLKYRHEWDKDWYSIRYVWGGGTGRWIFVCLLKLITWYLFNLLTSDLLWKRRSDDKDGGAWWCKRFKEVVKVWNSGPWELGSELTQNKWKRCWLSWGLLATINLNDTSLDCWAVFFLRVQSSRREFERDSSGWRLIRLAVLETKDGK